jgi:hypothetical protein
MPDTGQPLPPVTASVLRAAHALSASGTTPTVSRLAQKLGLSTSTVCAYRKKLIGEGLWEWPWIETPKPKAKVNGPNIRYTNKPTFREGEGGTVKRPRKTGKRVGRWPRPDRERIERELAEWREKAGIWLHPA